MQAEGTRDIRHGNELDYMNESARVPAALAGKRSDHGQVTLLIGLSQLIVTTDFSIVGVALPSIGKELAVPADLALLGGGGDKPRARGLPDTQWTRIRHVRAAALHRVGRRAVCRSVPVLRARARASAG